MKIRYDAYSPADEGERIVHGATLTVPADAGHIALHGLLERAVEAKALVDPGAQVRVIAWRSGVPDDDGKPFLTYSWDHA